jgi:hypothetical protein
LLLRENADLNHRLESDAAFHIDTEPMDDANVQNGGVDLQVAPQSGMRIFWHCIHTSFVV